MTSVFLSELFRDYLAHADSITAGVPANSVLKKQALSDEKVAAPPRLLVNVEADEEAKNPNRVVYKVALVITAENSLHARATTEGWMQAVRERLLSGDDYDLQDFQDWIQANRTEEQRTGWQMVRVRMSPAEEDFATEGDTKTYSISQPMRVTVRLR